MPRRWPARPAPLRSTPRPWAWNRSSRRSSGWLAAGARCGVASRGRRGDAARGGFPAAGDGGAGDGFGRGGGGFDGGDGFDGGADGGGAGQRTVNGVLADGTDAGPAEPTPVLAVVGRPNVGKSTMVNRILGSRQAVVEDTPGVTRDRVTYDATWRGRAFTLVDTGGWDPEVGRRAVLAAGVAAQARVAVDAADAVLFVVDAVVGITDADAAVAAVLRRSRKPVGVAANKVDDAPGESNVGSLWALGLGEPQSVSALHGRGSGDLLDAILDALPPAPGERFDVEAGPRRVALIGRPNVGKSSILNRLAGQERVLVDPVAGTTRDPVDELIDLGGKTWRFVDTAGDSGRGSGRAGGGASAAGRP